MSRKPSKSFKTMVDLLRQGATLTELACPACASPLFRLGNKELWCAECEKRVVVVKNGEREETDELLFSQVELTLMNKIRDIQRRIEEETNSKKLQSLSSTLSTLLENLQKVRKTRRNSVK